jgi:bifunctional isochorismate lyase / aryl carrier protein
MPSGPGRNASAPQAPNTGVGVGAPTPRQPAAIRRPFARFHDLPPLDHATLVLIDAQRAFLDPRSRTFVPDAERALPRARQLLDGFVARGLATVATRHAHLERPTPGGMGSWWASFLMEGTAEAELVPEVASRAATILTKHYYSAFRATALEQRLRASGTTTVVLAGFMTHICVDSTARDAFQLGFDVVVAADACASRPSALHEASLHGLSHAVARLGSVAELLAPPPERAS